MTGKLKVGILGAGNIANSMAMAVNGLKEDAIAYAVAARDLDRAGEFAAKWGFLKAYGSYEELASDPEIDLIYIATPHSFHYEHAMLCIEHGKNVLCEKAFTGTVRQTKALLQAAKEKGVFITEAIWTRYNPTQNIVKKLLAEGAIGEVTHMEADFSIHGEHIQRMYDPALAGGALLDLGIYCLTFASMYFGDDIVKTESKCTLYETGVDAVDDVYYTFADGKTAHLRTAFVTDTVANCGTIYGTEGSVFIDGLTCISVIRVYDKEGNLKQDVPVPKQINGYEFEVLACKKALEEGALQCPEMPHDETVLIMERMESLLKEWGVKYPFE